jgi:hypothetical protein
MLQRLTKLWDNLQQHINDRVMPDALDEQIGGGHYKDYPIQPVQFIHANKIGYLEGCVVKYICRHKQKNGVEDLLKAKHYIDLLIQMEYKNQNP